MASWSDDVVDLTRAALVPLRDPERAVPMAAYMKGVAPFLGVAAPARRAALRAAWRGVDVPTSDALGETALMLMAEREREFHYASYELIDRFRRVPDSYFLDAYVTELLTTKPWWDTVDGLVNAAVSPLSSRYDAEWLINEWSESGDRWLIRAAIGHQRGWKGDTDVSRVLSLCNRHWADQEFFVAKAIGWALRDLARLSPSSVTAFLEAQSVPNRVAEREALRGLGRAR